MSSSSTASCATKQERKRRTDRVPELPVKIARERRTWGGSNFWIGGGDRAGLFQWAQFSGEIQLCTAADIDRYLEAKHDPVYRGICLPVPEEVDNLAMIVKVSSESFNFQSCGLWNGPTPGAKTFADVRLKFLGVEPSHPILAADFQRALQTLDDLTFRARGTHTDVSPVIGNAGVAPGERVRFEHQLFESLAQGGSNRRPEKFEFSIKGWRAKHPEARQALKHMAKTHRVNYPIIWDINMLLAQPHMYEKVLRGAIVKVVFKLKRRGQSSRMRFACEVNSIWVLDMPPEM